MVQILPPRSFLVVQGKSRVRVGNVSLNPMRDYTLLSVWLWLFVITAGLFSGAVHEFEEYTENEHFLWELHYCHHEKDDI